MSDDRRSHQGSPGSARSRSISPRGDHRGPDRDARSYSSRGDSGYGSRGSSHASSRGRGGYGGRGGGRGRFGGGQEFQYSDLPVDPIPVPKGGHLFDPPPASSQGTEGIRTKVNVNHYQIQSLPTVAVFGYQLRMRVPSTSQRRGSEKVTDNQINTVIHHEAVRRHLGEHFVFDGVSMGWSPYKIQDIGQELETTIDLPGHNPERPNQIEIHLKSLGKMNIGALVNYLSEAKIELDPMGNKIIEPLLKWLNAVFRREPASRWVTRPKSSAYYDRTPETSMPLRSTGDVLEAIRGVFQTVQIRFGLLTLNVDTATTAFWTPEKNLIEMLHATSGLPMHQDLEAWCIQYPQRFSSASSRLVGMFFNVKHLKTARNARKVKITRWSVQDAYQTYNITLKYPKLPLVVTKDGHFPVELCYSAPGERYKETLQGAETSDFIRFATAPAFVRFQQIAENVKKLNWRGLSTPAKMGLSVKTNMLQIPARILPSPTPQYRHGTDHHAPEMGRWNLRGKGLVQPSSCAGWGLMYFPGTRNIDDSTLQELAVNMRKSLRELGVGISSDMPSFLRGNPMGDIKALIAELMGKSASVNGGAKPRLLVFLLHQGGDRLYSIIKTVCDTLFGVASQVMVAEKALSLRGQPQYLANVGLKVNVKLGGCNHVIKESCFQNRRWMMLGGDTSHPTPSQLRMNPPPPTFSALSASWDRDCARYTSVTSAQTAKTQLIDDFKAMAKVLLQRYAEKNNGSLPDSIVYYRDGLSEGEFNQILITEAAPLKELCAEYRGNSPKLTVVVCVKRHHTRLFPTERGDKNGNVLPGTVVENNSKTNDIYLVAHPGLQGTNRPTRYATLIDENNLSANDFQRMTNNICWSYARATCAVSIVAPVYYADQACERAKLHVREAEDGTQILGQVHKDLTWSMFWQ